MALNGKGEQVQVNIPDWVRKEPDRKRFGAFVAYLLDWDLFGFKPDGDTLEEYFTLDREGWTKEDTNYIIQKFKEHGYLEA